MVKAKSNNNNRTYLISGIIATLALVYAACTDGSDASCEETGRYPTWEAAPASTKEFDHDNDKSVCRLPILSVEEWEDGRYWEREEPVIVKNVTDGWKAMEHWTK